MDLTKHVFLSAAKSQLTENSFIYGAYFNGCLVCSFTDYKTAVKFQESGKKGFNIDYSIQKSQKQTN